MFSSQSSPANPSSNPFAQPVQNPFGAVPKNTFQGSSTWQTTPKENPFSKPNPFDKTEKANKPSNPQPTKSLHNPFATNGVHPKPASQPSTDLKPSTAGGFGNPRPNPFLNGPSSTKSSPAHGFVQPAWSTSKDTNGATLTTSPKPALNGKAVNGKRMNDGTQQEKPTFLKNLQGPKKPSNLATATVLTPKHVEKTNPVHRATKPQKPKGSRRGNEVAAKIRDQLAKDGLKPPPWPSNPGSLAQRKAVEKYREAYSAYREKAMKSLIRAGLFDDPDKKRRLSEAINFRGICEDMCPDWDKVTRIVQHDVRKEEKEEINGELVASLPLMVTRYSRSSAGQDLPLPMDVRSPGALRRTLDYLIADLIPSDDLLPVRHHFLWDRTRAIRREFTFQGSAMSREEKKDLLYCLETITRFHVTALHLLSKPDFGHEGFSEQQEIEQLSKTLISLMEAYEDCAKEGIVCENEAEFRGYYIIFNAADPILMEKVESWGPQFLELEGIQTAICLVQSLQNTWTETGPMFPRVETDMALSMATTFFSIIASPQISYTMACFAEVHFGSARQSILQTILNGYQRPKNGTKDITPTFLKEHLHLDSEEEAVKFGQLHNFRFRTDKSGKQMMLLPIKRRQKSISKPRVPHAHSYNIVERKRGSRLFPEVIFHTVWDEGHTKATEESQLADPEEESLFVNGYEDGGSEVESDIETVSTAVSAPARPEAEKSPFTSSLSSPSIFTPPNQQKGLLATSTTTQGIQSRDFAPQVNSSLTTPSPLFTKPLEGKFNQGADVKTPQNFTALAAPSTEKTNEKEDAQSGTPSSTETSLFSFLGTKSGAPAALSSPGQSSLFSQISATSSLKNGTPSTPGFLTPASAPSAKPLFPTPLGTSTSTTEPTPATKTPVSTGDAFLTPKEPTSNTTGLSMFTSQGSTMPQHSTSPFTPAGSSAFPPLAKPSQPAGEQPQSLGAFQPRPLDKEIPPSQPQKPDLMDRFTRWYTCGDRGLMETHIERYVIENLLKGVWDEYLQTEEERKRKEEDEKSWAEARKYRESSLSIKYFYKWRDGSRHRRAINRIRAERDKARQWRLPENVAKREAAAKAAREKKVKEAKDLMHRKARENAEQTYRLNQSIQSNRQSQSSRQSPSQSGRQSLSESRRQSREHSIENALLASGVLDGVRDPQEAARYAARDAKTDSDEGMLPGEQMLLRVKNQRRRKQGLQPLKQIPEPKIYKEGSKTAMLKALSNGSGRDSLSMSTGSFRNSTFSSSYRSSLGFNSSRISKTQSKVTDPYWRLKASGLVQMPNGEYLHESLALPMLREGKRFPGLGDYGLPKEQSISPTQLSPLGNTSPARYSPSNELQPHRISGSPSLGNIFSRRKRIRIDEDEDVDDSLALVNRREVSGDRKRAKNGSEHDVNSNPNEPDLLANIDSLLQQVQDVNRASSHT